MARRAVHPDEVGLADVFRALAAERCGGGTFVAQLGQHVRDPASGPLRDEPD